MHPPLTFHPDLSTPFDYEHQMNALLALEKDSPLLQLSYLGNSILNRSIPLLKLGSGRREVLYVAAHHGMEWITSALLTQFAADFCQRVLSGRPVGKYHPKDLLETTTIYILPMLNPDGVEYQIHGVDPENPLCERVVEMNGGSSDFSHWQANARGVDLNHNYDAGFGEYKKLEEENGIFEGAPTRYSGVAPESEAEVRLLCDFIRFHEQLRGVITLHTQGEEIYYKSGGKIPPGSAIIARRLHELTGYRLSDAEGLASFGGLTDWCVRSLSLPSFTLECGRGENPLPFSAFSTIYARIQGALFAFPTLV